MLTWMIVIIVALANFRVGRSIAMWFRPRLPGVRPATTSTTTATAFVAVVGAFAFFVWNQQAQVLPFTFLHAAVLGGSSMLGYPSIEQRQRSLQSDINELAGGVADALAQSIDDEERLDALTKAARQNQFLADQFDEGLLSAHLTADRGSAPRSASEKVDLLLQEFGSVILAKFGEDAIPKARKDALGTHAKRALKEANERTRALLDASAIDWEAVDEAVYHISEARLRRGVPVDELTSLEQRIRAQRTVRANSPAATSSDQIIKSTRNAANVAGRNASARPVRFP